MTDLGDSKEDAESLVNDVKKVAEKTTVSGLLLYYVQPANVGKQTIIRNLGAGIRC